MSKFAKFMKANKTVKENEYYAATKSLCDEYGTPLLWEFRHITSKENEIIREDCTRDVPVVGKPKVTTADAREALRAAVGLEDLTAAQKSKADADGDGNVTTADAREILRKATGLEK